jgi:hypothetical protein
MENNIIKADASLPTLAAGYGEVAGEGLEIGLHDTVVPFISLLQPQSKVCDKKEKESYIPGMEPGMIFNASTKVGVDGEKGILLIPALRRPVYFTEYNEAGNFVAEHKPQDQIVTTARANAKGRELLTENGNSLRETLSLVAIQVDEDLNPIGYVIVNFQSTKMKAWRNYFNAFDTTRVNVNGASVKLSQAVPLWVNVVRLTAKIAEGKQGKYYTYDLAPHKGNVIASLLPVEHPAAQTAKDLREAFLAGKAKADTSSAKAETEVGGHF